MRLCVDARRRLLLAGTYGGDLLAYALPIAKSTAGAGGSGSGSGALVTGAGAGAAGNAAASAAAAASVTVGLNPLARFPLHSGPIAAMRFAPMTDRLYSAGRDGVVMVTQVHMSAAASSVSLASSSSSTALVVASGASSSLELFTAHRRRFGGDAELCLVRARDVERVETRVLQLERAAALGRGENEEALQMLRLYA